MQSGNMQTLLKRENGPFLFFFFDFLTLQPPPCSLAVSCSVVTDSSPDKVPFVMVSGELNTEIYSLLAMIIFSRKERRDLLPFVFHAGAGVVASVEVILKKLCALCGLSVKKQATYTFTSTTRTYIA